MLALLHIGKTFGRPDAAGRLTVLRDIVLGVAPGDRVAVLGPSGSGKSTLLHIMGGLERPTSGRLTFRGRDMADLDDDALARLRRHDIGFVFQRHHLLPQCTVWENVLAPTAPCGPRRARAEWRRRAYALLERVGLADRANYLPACLSGGERQRVAVARALINEPSLILADEPTGALDRATARAVMELLVEVNAEAGAALVVVTHAEELAAYMTRRYRLRDGALHAEHPPAAGAGA